MLVTPIDEGVTENLLNIIENVNHCYLQDNTLPKFFKEYMTPYFKDEASYEECVDKLRDRLELYLSE